jgi:hypothetical protein
LPLIFSSLALRIGCLLAHCRAFAICIDHALALTNFSERVRPWLGSGVRRAQGVGVGQCLAVGRCRAGPLVTDAIADQALDSSFEPFDRAVQRIERRSVGMPWGI